MKRCQGVICDARRANRNRGDSASLKDRWDERSEVGHEMRLSKYQSLNLLNAIGGVAVILENHPALLEALEAGC